MAICVELQADGTLVPTGQPVDQCTGYVLVSGSEYGIYSFMHDALAIPDSQVVGGWFVGALGAVMFWYVVSRMAGSVATFFK